VAKNICDQNIEIDETHPSINAISEKYSNATKSHQLIFKHIDESFVSKRVSNINAKTATGVDNISPKLLHYAIPVIANPISVLVNLSLSSATFPDSLKITRVAPIHKKNSALEKGNNRPVCVLSAISKIFETAIEKQLSLHFENLFNPFLAAFRSGYGCQSTLLRILEDWKKALDSDTYLAAILLDLSKAFEWLQHDILLLKLGNNRC
jgi:potassium voltage-gated channel Eag-related subfamily H protein 8